MTSPNNQASLIDELESRQNDVLDRIAELNARVEDLLNECLVARDARLKEETDREQAASMQPKSVSPDQPASEPS